MAMDPEKLRRTNLINRRTVAWLVEVTFLSVTLIPPLITLYMRLVPEDIAQMARGETPTGLWLAQLAVWGAYILVRDLLGSASLGKRLVGLGVAPAMAGAAAAADAPVSAGRRVLRSVPIAIPFVPVVEFFVAYYGNPGMQRLGDQWAGTQVVDRAPERMGRGAWSGQLLLAFLLLIVVQAWAVPRLTVFWVGVLF